MEFWRGMEFWLEGCFGFLWRLGMEFYWSGFLQFFVFFGVGASGFFFGWLSFLVHAGMEFWCFLLVLYQDFFRTCFSGFFPGLSSCGLFATRFQFLGPHGPGFFHRPSIWNIGPPKPELTLEPWRHLAFTATPTSMAAWLPVEDSGRLSRCCSR